MLACLGQRVPPQRAHLGPVSASKRVAPIAASRPFPSGLAAVSTHPDRAPDRCCRSAVWRFSGRATHPHRAGGPGEKRWSGVYAQLRGRANGKPGPGRVVGPRERLTQRAESGSPRRGGDPAPGHPRPVTGSWRRGDLGPAGAGESGPARAPDDRPIHGARADAVSHMPAAKGVVDEGCQTRSPGCVPVTHPGEPGRPPAIAASHKGEADSGRRMTRRKSANQVSESDIS